MLEFIALAQECAPTVAPQTMAAVVNVESGYNPYAIGVVGGRLSRQPKNREEAVATAQQLAANGWNFSLGVAQVNRDNLPKYQITYEQAFDPCTNLRVGSKILEDCYVRASKRISASQAALHAAFSCYYSGNFTRGFKPDVAGKPSYVQKVLASAKVAPKPIHIVPAPGTGSGPKPQFDKAAGTSAPSTPKSSSPEPAALSSDNAPVLLRTKGTADSTAKRQPLATGVVGGQPHIVPNETSADNPVPASSAIVF
ncbi:lytic transglycosylase domain-containing protein [Microvirgula aerodenitrificans]|uniref:lytic transglycosylase domain-containing protein n=1 Tax=Microvirgula aerodenitrificans TaxID=57480 RepID=UPI00248ED15D|nr:lytic transglycosylase domain-containing protein [Microvirgula aerodenitrificans]